MRAATPGRKFWTTTSACAANWRSAARCLGSRASSTTLSLPALNAIEMAVCPPRWRPMLRPQSPAGGSTLMTRAPCCRRIKPQYGPAMPWLASRTVTPSRGASWFMSSPSDVDDDLADRAARHGGADRFFPVREGKVSGQGRRHGARGDRPGALGDHPLHRHGMLLALVRQAPADIQAIVETDQRNILHQQQVDRHRWYAPRREPDGQYPCLRPHTAQRCVEQVAAHGVEHHVCP